VRVIRTSPQSRLQLLFRMASDAASRHAELQLQALDRHRYSRLNTSKVNECTHYRLTRLWDLDCVHRCSKCHRQTTNFGWIWRCTVDTHGFIPASDPFASFGWGSVHPSTASSSTRPTTASTTFGRDATLPTSYTMSLRSVTDPELPYDYSETSAQWQFPLPFSGCKHMLCPPCGRFAKTQDPPIDEVMNGVCPSSEELMVINLSPIVF
jgi:hypothetical protein